MARRETSVTGTTLAESVYFQRVHACKDKIPQYFGMTDPPRASLQSLLVH